MGNETSAHERAAALLGTHPDYRVLRALPSVGGYPCARPQGPVRTAAVIDVETVGLDPDHPIIDLAIQRIAFDACGVIVQVGQPRQWFEDPGTPIPAEITRLTGITDADVAGTRIDADEASKLIASTTVEATNAPFEAKDMLKAKGYRWHPDKRTWWTEIPAGDQSAELDWLRDACSCARPNVIDITWHQRHRG